jgi:ABC-type lipoprotein export system ATPase subunit
MGEIPAFSGIEMLLKKNVMPLAMVNRPDIFFADEPCANLDTENSRMVLDFSREINEQMHQTIVMVSHED